ncbi:MAG: hypothetical protein ACETWB_06720 [Anaerolineae bacterium]
MITVRVKKEYQDILAPDENLQETVDALLREQAIERANRRIVELRQKMQGWEEKYGCSYDLFVYRTATDEEYVAQLNASTDTAQWEADLLTWEFYAQELREWYQRLQNALTA